MTLRRGKENIDITATKSAESKLDAFNSIMEFVRTHPGPKDFDPEQAREEAMREKYGKYFS